MSCVVLLQPYFTSQVIAASYVPRDSDILDEATSEAPLTINIPYALPEGTQEPSESPWLSRGMNITFPLDEAVLHGIVEAAQVHGGANALGKRLAVPVA